MSGLDFSVRGIWLLREGNLPNPHIQLGKYCYSWRLGWGVFHGWEMMHLPLNALIEWLQIHTNPDGSRHFWECNHVCTPGRWLVAPWNHSHVLQSFLVAQPLLFLTRQMRLSLDSCYFLSQGKWDSPWSVQSTWHNICRQTNVVGLSDVGNSMKYLQKCLQNHGNVVIGGVKSSSKI